MWEIWKTGSSLDGSGIFTRTSFRNKGWQQIVYRIDIIYSHNSHNLVKQWKYWKKLLVQNQHTFWCVFKTGLDFVCSPFGLNGQDLLICTSCTVYWTLGWRVCLSLKKWTAWQLGSGAGSHWKGKHTVPYCSWSWTVSHYAAVFVDPGSWSKSWKPDSIQAKIKFRLLLTYYLVDWVSQFQTDLFNRFLNSILLLRRSYTQNTWRQKQQKNKGCYWIYLFLLTSVIPSHWTWFWIHSSLSEFSFSLTPSFTREQSSSAFSRASRSWAWSTWFSGVLSRIWWWTHKLTQTFIHL